MHCANTVISRLPRLGSRVRIPSPAPIFPTSEDDGKPRFPRVLAAVLLPEGEAPRGPRKPVVACGLPVWPRHSVRKKGVIPFRRPSPHSREAKPACMISGITVVSVGQTLVADNSTASMTYRDDPIVVLGTAGTGTRVFSDLLESAGVFMGARRNAQRDNLDFIDILKDGMPIADRGRPCGDSYLARIGSPDFALERLDDATRARAEDLCARFRQVICGDLDPEQRYWGWKKSQSMFFLPLLKRYFPGMQVVHVVRDGRDIAFSKQQRAPFQAAYVQCLTNTPIIPDDDEAWSIKVAEMWRIINLGVATWARRCLDPGNYFQARLESLAEDPVGYTRRYLDALGLDGASAAECVENSRFDPSELRLRKYMERGKETVRRIEDVAGEALLEFGYL